MLHRVTPGASQDVGWRSVLFWRKLLAASSAGPKGWIPAAVLTGNGAPQARALIRGSRLVEVVIFVGSPPLIGS